MLYGRTHNHWSTVDLSLRSNMFKLHTYVLVLYAALAASAASAERPASLSVQEAAELTPIHRAQYVCDLSVETAKIDWQEAGHLSEEEFDRILPTSRADAVVAAEAYDEMARLLRKHGADSVVATDLLGSAASFQMYGLVDWLINRGVPVDGNSETLPPLVRAASCGRLEMMTHLLERGADPNVYFAERNAAEPMVLAIAMTHAGMAELLLAHGYDPCRTELADGRDLRDLLERHPELAPEDAFWGQLVCSEGARKRARR